MNLTAPKIHQSTSYFYSLHWWGMQRSRRTCPTHPQGCPFPRSRTSSHTRCKLEGSRPAECRRSFSQTAIRLWVSAHPGLQRLGKRCEADRVEHMVVKTIRNSFDILKGTVLKWVTESISHTAPDISTFHIRTGQFCFLPVRSSSSRGAVTFMAAVRRTWIWVQSFIWQEESERGDKRGEEKVWGSNEVLLIRT